MRPIRTAFVLASLAVAPLAADCGDIVGNLIPNCHFDSAITGWTVDSGSAAHTVATGNPNMASLLAGTTFIGPGAVSVTGHPLVKISQCVNTSQYGPYSFFFAYLADNATEETCRVFALEYNATGCPDGTAVETVEQNDGDLLGWEWRNGTIQINQTARSIELAIQCEGVGGSNASATFDDAVLKRDFIFLDNLESGGLTRWSTSSGAVPDELPSES